MSRISVIGGTGYVGSAIVARAASRGHEVTVLAKDAPAAPLDNVTYVHGDATDPSTLSSVIDNADVVVAALAPRGSFLPIFRQVNRTIAELADTAGARLYVVGGFSSLRPAPGANRFVTDLSDIPAELHEEIHAGAALIIEDLPATPESLNWVFVSPAMRFGARMPSEPLGTYLLGNDVSVQPHDGGKLSVHDYALGFVDLIDNASLSRVHVNLGNPTS